MSTQQEYTVYETGHKDGTRAGLRCALSLLKEVKGCYFDGWDHPGEARNALYEVELKIKRILDD